MIWPFRRRKPTLNLTTPHVGPTSVDWQIGDMAECVEAGGWHPPSRHAPRLGEKLMVSGVVYDRATVINVSLFALKFVGKPDAWQAECFRKIVPVDTGADRKVSKRKSVSERA